MLPRPEWLNLVAILQKKLRKKHSKERKERHFILHPTCHINSVCTGTSLSLYLQAPNLTNLGTFMHLACQDYLVITHLRR